MVVCQNIFCLLGLFLIAAEGGHFIIPGSAPYDAYHNLHLPHNPPLYPTFAKVPHTSFTCKGRNPGYYADVQTGCQAYHMCQPNVEASFLCTNGTLFNEQFQVCDQFYNVRCGSPYLDLFK
ncbi:U-scoloptoxin(01)-Cw1a-like [Coccinella septempunctata]|uniref:U-scoloptoxin(01)-Cw1a-like n=1 Tax=Coccinella septempunctata TaxID=41139 RepID=UPI001D096E92|nr:U-scoloptoxin(01)-Cw1a-like [Coccinella septempunctata]